MQKSTYYPKYSVFHHQNVDLVFVFWSSTRQKIREKISNISLPISNFSDESP